jgi:hypothetical protein
MIVSQIEQTLKQNDIAKMCTSEVSNLTTAIQQTQDINQLYYHRWDKKRFSRVSMSQMLQNVLEQKEDNCLSKKDVRSNVKYLPSVGKKLNNTLPENVMKLVMNMEVDSPKAIMISVENKVKRSERESALIDQMRHASIVHRKRRRQQMEMQDR